jgi:hypothetical protein
VREGAGGHGAAGPGETLESVQVVSSEAQLSPLQARRMPSSSAALGPNRADRLLQATFDSHGSDSNLPSARIRDSSQLEPSVTSSFNPPADTRYVRSVSAATDVYTTPSGARPGERRSASPAPTGSPARRPGPAEPPLTARPRTGWGAGPLRRCRRRPVRRGPGADADDRARSGCRRRGARLFGTWPAEQDDLRRLHWKEGKGRVVRLGRSLHQIGIMPRSTGCWMRGRLRPLPDRRSDTGRCMDHHAQASAVQRPYARVRPARSVTSASRGGASST